MTSSRASICAALCLLLGSCSLLVERTDDALEPCHEPVEPPRILFPRNNSGVLGTVPIIGVARDCSGIHSVVVNMSTTTSAANDPFQVLTPVYYDESERFDTLTEVPTWSDDHPSARLAAVMEPIRTSIAPTLSSYVSVAAFDFELRRSEQHPGSWTPPPFWAFADFDLDGDRDLLWSDDENQSFYRVNESGWPFVTGTSWFPMDYCLAHEEHCDVGEIAPPIELHAVADLNNDDVLDVLASIGVPARRELMILGGAIIDTEWVVSPMIVEDFAELPRVTAIVVLDADLDGWLDLLIAHEGGVVVGRRTEIDEWSLLESVQTGIDFDARPLSLTVGDIFGADGYPDVVAATETGVLVFRNSGNTSRPMFTPEATYPWGRWIQLADFDRDGDLDFVVPFEHHGFPVALWRLESDGTYSNATGEHGYGGGILADINNDGFLDARSALGTLGGRFTPAVLDIVGIPVDISGHGRNLTLELLPLGSPAPDTYFESTLPSPAADGRLAARVDLPTFLQGNRHGFGTRVRVVASDDDPDHPAREGWGVSMAEIGSLWSGALAGVDVQFGVDSELTYDVHFRLPTPELTTHACEGITNRDLVLLAEEESGFQCQVSRVMR